MDTELIGGRYRLDGELGSGGMGTVWRGFDELLARPVAVKEIRFPPHTSAREHAELTARAMTEARAAAALTHPAIVAVHDVTMHDGRPWIIMQLVPGRSLQQLVAEDGPLSPEEAAHVGLRLLDALQTAHAGGVTHRDVKPSNVLMPGGGASAMLTDFSIAKVVGYGTTNTGVPVGSAGYIAPERMLTGVSGEEGDLFGLGATLFFAVEGVGPFHRPDPMVSILAAAIEPHPRPKLAGNLTALLDALLTKDPRQRAALGQARAMLLTAQAPPPPAPPAVPAPSSQPLTSSVPVPQASQAPVPVSDPLAPPASPQPFAPLAAPAPSPLAPLTPEPLAPPAPPPLAPHVSSQPLAPPAAPASEPLAPPAVPVPHVSPQPLAPPAVPAPQSLAQPAAPVSGPLAPPAVPVSGPLAPHVSPQTSAPPAVPVSQPLAPAVPQSPAPPAVSASSVAAPGVSGPDVEAGSRAASSAAARQVDDPPTVQIPQWNKVQGQAGFTRGRASVPGPPPARKPVHDLPSPDPEPRPDSREERRRPRRSLLVAGAGFVAAAAIGGTAWALRDRKPGQVTSGGPSSSPTPLSNLDVLSGHRDEVWAVAWAPDSQRLASASSDFTVRLWTTSSGTATRVLTGHSGEVSAVEWSPDGKLVASGAADNGARIWDAQTGEVAATLQHEQAVRAVAWSPDGRLLATGCNDRKVRIWDVSSGQVLRTLVAHTSAVLAVAWSPDGKALASVGDLGDQAGFLLGSVFAARVWDPFTGTQTMTVQTGKRVAPAPARRLDGHASVQLAGMAGARRGLASPATTSVAWSPDSALLATGNDASTTWLWDAKTGEQLRVLGGHSDIVNAVAFKPDEALLVTASADLTILLWNPGSSTVLRTFTGHTSAVNTLAFSPDGKRLVSGSSDKTLRLWTAVA